jgi:hypothetical protein
MCSFADYCHANCACSRLASASGQPTPRPAAASSSDQQNGRRPQLFLHWLPGSWYPSCLCKLRPSPVNCAPPGGTEFAREIRDKLLSSQRESQVRDEVVLGQSLRRMLCSRVTKAKSMGSPHPSAEHPLAFPNQYPVADASFTRLLRKVSFSLPSEQRDPSEVCYPCRRVCRSTRWRGHAAQSFSPVTTPVIRVGRAKNPIFDDVGRSAPAPLLAGGDALPPGSTGTLPHLTRWCRPFSGASDDAACRCPCSSASPFASPNPFACLLCASFHPNPGHSPAFLYASNRRLRVN